MVPPRSFASGGSSRRPAPLQLDASSSHCFHNDELVPRWEIPVHRTFIEYGNFCCQGSPTPHINTAPAWMGPSLRNVFDSGKGICTSIWAPQRITMAGTATSTPTSASRYHMSPTSAKAAGYTSTTACPLINSSQAVHLEVRCPPSRAQSASTIIGTPSPRSAPDVWEPYDRQGEAHIHAEIDHLLTAKTAATAVDRLEVPSTASSDDGESSDDEGRCPMYSESAAIPSMGSAMHRDGTCKRCCFFPKGRCNNGYDCQFCHFAHEKRKPKNKKKKKRRKKQPMKTSLPGIMAPAMDHQQHHHQASLFTHGMTYGAQLIVPSPLALMHHGHMSPCQMSTILPPTGMTSTEMLQSCGGVFQLASGPLAGHAVAASPDQVPMAYAWTS